MMSGFIAKIRRGRACGEKKLNAEVALSVLSATVFPAIFFRRTGEIQRRRDEEDAGFPWVAPCQRARRACSGGPKRCLQKV
jgi:hypothetical protein